MNELPVELKKNIRRYSYTLLDDNSHYELIQELFPSFSIERFVEVLEELREGYNDMNEYEKEVFETLDRSKQYELYENGDIEGEDLDLPYMTIDYGNGFHSIQVEDVNVPRLARMLHISSTLKFKPTNRNTYMSVSEGKEYLPFNEELMSKYNNISLSNIYDYAVKLSMNRSSGVKVQYVRSTDKVLLDDNEVGSGRDLYIKYVMSIANIL